MGILNIDGILLKKMIICGANLLDSNRQLVDSLNVYPVPDGDTGTNMSLTVLAAAKEVEKLNTPNISDVAKAAANGSLRGARGNSGVILSQLFRGFSKALEGKALANVDDISEAFTKASETAYKAVMKPKEGTILTIARTLAEKANEIAFDTEDIEEMASSLLQYGNEILAKTTDMLEQLKQAGVVDAGGKGLLFILEGALSAISYKGEVSINTATSQNQAQPLKFTNTNTEDIKYTYCTEFFINSENINESVENNLKNYLETIGDSIVVVSDEKLIKIHVHTNNPGLVMEKSLKYGVLSNIKIENMQMQHTNLINFVSEVNEEKINLNNEHKNTGFIAVAMGNGISQLFKNLGIDRIIEGGQTMNPSADDFISAINYINADNIIILPNNKNVILAAQQAAEIGCPNKNIYVVPSATIPQGFSAIINYTQDLSLEHNLENMKNSIDSVKTGQITYAVRDTIVDGKEIKEGDFLCILEGKIIDIAHTVEDATQKLITQMATTEYEFMSIYYGHDISQDEAEKLQTFAKANFSDYEVELHKGDQPLFYYIISVE